MRLPGATAQADAARLAGADYTSGSLGSTQGAHLPLIVAGHPLSAHYMSILRDAETGSEQFRETTRRLAYTLLIEATSDLSLETYEVTSPMGPATGHRISRQLVAVAVLRAGLGLLDAVIDLLPNVKVGYAGVQRNEETAQPQEYYTKFPDLGGAKSLVLEPMLATGGSLSWAVERLKAAGADDITALCVVAAPDGVARMQTDHPDVTVVTAAVDSHLNDQFYIVPGLGDMGDRLFGTL